MSVPPLPPNEGVVEVWMPALAPFAKILFRDDDEDDLYMTPPPETVHNENANNSEDEDDLYMTPPPENLNGHVENQEAVEEAAHVDVTMTSPYHPLPPATYQGLAAYRVIRWDPSEVICCIGEDLFVPDEHRHVINQHLLRLFEEKINTDQPFLEQAQRRAVVFIRTPEHERQTVREQERAERLQMTSPTLRRERSALRGSIRQPVFEDLSRPSHPVTSNPAQPPISLAPPIQLHQPATLAPPVQSYYSAVAAPSAPSYYPAQYVPPHFYPAPMFQHSVYHGATAYQIPGQYPIYAPPPMPAPPPHYWPVNVSAYPNLPRHLIGNHDRQARIRLAAANHPDYEHRMMENFERTHAERGRRRRESTRPEPNNPPHPTSSIRQQEENNHYAILDQRHQQDIQQQQHLHHQLDLAEQAHHLDLEEQAYQHNLAIQQNNQAVVAHQALQNLPLGRRPYQEPIARHSLGLMNIECAHCLALHFSSERLTNSSRIHPRFGMCCLQGQIRLPAFLQPPPTLRRLLWEGGSVPKFFRDHIRQYNSAFAFTSIAAKLSDHVTSTSGPYSFKIHGELSHKMGSLLPPNNIKPSYAQLYVIDPQAALNERNNNNANLRSENMNDLQDMFHTHNPYVPLYRHAYQILAEKNPGENDKISARITVLPNADHRRYNEPTVDEVAAIIPGNGDEEVDLHRDIVVRYNYGGLKHFSHLHPHYSPLHYVTLFPHGEQGFHPNIPAHPGLNGQMLSSKVSQRCYYAYRLMRRLLEPETIFRAGKLFQQYVVDAWASIESSNLFWIRNHQKEIRADKYQSLFDAIHAEAGKEYWRHKGQGL
ncbi:hypothetical protein HETIRDRAFT_428038 [Heterobasidion irregulare TC 32-1]|uniref:Helitron helicase-like domain-containing protein n=1 Tax=Heterobasidion irregulare (strain TC 32-1) TaxID=747525 RepID=W4K1C2_HETIT|nr:uncharacterized protein HETIRDRAFT_428038 [Heterobasidion irregulare TC 32-1]ETW79519.1 hypothetical protein HETIRDRAFT_428038 [Heterobasidion irregulare TC 32-1]